MQLNHKARKKGHDSALMNKGYTKKTLSYILLISAVCWNGPPKGENPFIEDLVNQKWRTD